MAAPQNKESDDDTEDWLTTYADAITLLMAFFIMLLNFSKIDIPKFEDAAAGISNKIGMGPEKKSPISILKLNLQDSVMKMEASKAVDVSTDDKGVVIELASSAFYKVGSADIRDEAVPILAEMGDQLEQPKYKTYKIEVEGHTDDVPINTPMFPSNWELSTRRATTVVRFFIDQGIRRERLKAAGYAETEPKVPNREPDGTPIPENQAKNRRVVLRVYPMSFEESEQMYEQMSVEEFRQGKTAAPPDDRPAPGEPQAPAQPQEEEVRTLTPEGQ